MSTSLGKLKAKIEIPNTEKRISEYKNTDVFLTSFFGGIKRGKSLQIGFYNEEGVYVHIQLSRDEVLKIKEMLETF